jgi:hypothetical protein
VKWQIAATVLICGLMLVDASLYISRHPAPTNEPAIRLVAAVRDNHLEQVFSSCRTARFRYFTTISLKQP